MKKLLKELNPARRTDTHSQKGSTMLELLLYMGILSILLTTLTSIFTSALDVQTESTAASSVEQDGNFILARLAYDIHRATSVSIPALGVTDNNFRIVIGVINYTYSIDGNNLTLTNDFGTNNLNNYDSSVSAFMVTHLGNGMVEDSLKIDFTVTSKTKKKSGYETKDFETSLSLRRQ